MKIGLQLPTWINPYTGEVLASAFLVFEYFGVDLLVSRYEAKTSIYASQEAHSKGYPPLAKMNFAGGDGVFPEWMDALTTDPFLQPLCALRDWGLESMKKQFPDAVDVFS